MRLPAAPALMGCALLWAAPGIAQEPTTERECGIMQQMGSMVEGVPAPWLHVLHRSANDPPLALPVGTRVVGCLRDSIIPGPHDDEIPLLGVPLTLSIDGARRSISLRFTDGRFSYQLVQGVLTETERNQIESRIAEFQARRPPMVR